MSEFQRDDSRLLRMALRANAAFSVVTGIAMLAFADQFGVWMGVPSAILFWVGLVVAINAVPMTLQTISKTIPRNQTLLTIAGDVLWVVASIVIVAWRPAGITTTGVTLVVVVAGIVAVFAVAQFLGFRRYKTALLGR